MYISKELLYKSDSGSPTFTKNQFSIPWSMSRAEQYCMIQLLSNNKPNIAIEIGTYKGGSLQVLSHYATKVYAIDISSDSRDSRCDNLNNVDYLIGDSKVVLPELLKKIEDNGEDLEFILIDGDHSEKGVFQDILNIMSYTPKKALQIILHDSFNPNCRKGMKRYDYNTNKKIHYIELDFIPGMYNHDGLSRQMWGGFATIIMLPEDRNKTLQIFENQKKSYEITYFKSIHFIKNIFGFIKPIFRSFKK